MKNIVLYLLLFLVPLFTACEDVIDVDLDTAEPKLVIEASIRWGKGTSGNWQVVRLSTSTNFYSTEIPMVSGAIVFITNSRGDRFDFYEVSQENKGYYICTDFIPEIDETYALTVEYENEIYTATETLRNTPDLEEVQQTKEGFDDDQITIKAFFRDPVEERNYYMHGFRRAENGPEYGVFDDEFVNGNYTFTVRIFNDLEPDEMLGIDLYNISERHFAYMDKIFITTSDNNLGPFQVAPPKLVGNIINETNPSNTAYGYFFLSEVTTIDYIVQ